MADPAVHEPDAAARLARVADLCESLARSEPATFDRLSFDALRWPTALVSSVLADLSAGFEQEARAQGDSTTPLARSLHFVELWVEALRGAYTDRDASAHDRERARLALRVLRGQALGLSVCAPSAR